MRRYLAYDDKASPVFRAGYAVGVALLLLFHLELFSGGFICKQLFAKVPM